MVPIEVFILSCLIALGCGILAGRQQGKDICSEKVRVILEQYNFKDDENNGDA